MSRRFQNQRKSIRLEGYDYSSLGAYFVTICANVHGFDWFGALSRDSVVLNAAGQMVETELHNLPKRFSNLDLDTYVIMPDHIHAILVLKDLPNANAQGRGEPCVRPATRPKQQDPVTQPKQQTLVQFDSLIPQSVTGDDKHRPYENTVANGTTPNCLGRILQAFKSLTTNQYIRGVREMGWQPFEKRFWERNYWEHIIEFEEELENTRNYILENPQRALETKGKL